MNAEQLMALTEQSIAAAEADMGKELIDAGGWVDVVRGVVQMEWDTPVAAKAEVLRRHGLEPDEFTVPRKPGARWTAPGGIRVEYLVVNDRGKWRVTDQGFWAGDAATVRQLARLVDLERLEEVRHEQSGQASGG